MKKDIEWLKKEIATEMIEIEPNRKEKWSDIKYQTLRSVAQKIHQLDEPEVLSQEWLDDNVVHVRGLGDIFEAVAVESLLVPEKEITEKQVINWLDHNEFYDHITAETVLERAVDKGELSYYGTKYSVIEAPIIPKYLADAETLKELKELGELLISTSLNFTHPQFEDTYPEWSMVHSIGERLIEISEEEVAE